MRYLLAGDKSPNLPAIRIDFGDSHPGELRLPEGYERANLNLLLCSEFIACVGIGFLRYLKTGAGFAFFGANALSVNDEIEDDPLDWKFTDLFPNSDAAKSSIGGLILMEVSSDESAIEVVAFLIPSV